jgi:exodeoxyribonuclease VII large subunit
MSDLFAELNSLNKPEDTASVTINPADMITLSRGSLAQMLDPAEESSSFTPTWLQKGAKVKDITTHIAWIGTQRKVELLDELLIALKHNSVAVRRAALKAIENLADKKAISALKNLRESESDRATLIILEATLDSLERQREMTATDNSSPLRNVYQVSEFLSTMKILISAKNFVIEGEVGEVNIYHQVIYFTIKDKKTEERLDCLAFYTIMNRLDFALNSGLSIRITGKASLSKSSKLRLQVSFMQLTGEGEFLRNLKLLQVKLEKEGLFDPNRKREIPNLPRKIALLTSKNSAAKSDFLKVLGERRTALEICVMHIKTQGDGALQILYSCLQSLQSELETPNSAFFGCEVVIITRGGGSQEDLNVFNQEQITRAIHALSVPSIVAIGHEKDWTLAEMAADKRASTPTQAAIFASLSNQECLSEAVSCFTKTKHSLEYKILNYQRFVEQNLILISRRLNIKIKEAESILKQTELFFQKFIAKIQQTVAQSFYLIQKNIHTSFEMFSLNLTQNQLLWNRFLADFYSRSAELDLGWRLILSSINMMFKDFQNSKSHLFQLIQGYDIDKVIARGFAIVFDSEDKVVEKWSSVPEGQVFQIRLQDGLQTVKKSPKITKNHQK